MHCCFCLPFIILRFSISASHLHSFAHPSNDFLDYMIYLNLAASLVLPKLHANIVFRLSYFLAFLQFNAFQNFQPLKKLIEIEKMLETL